jgi:hypothetical protein
MLSVTRQEGQTSGGESRDQLQGQSRRFHVRALLLLGTEEVVPHIDVGPKVVPHIDVGPIPI